MGNVFPAVGWQAQLLAPWVLAWTGKPGQEITGSKMLLVGMISEEHRNRSDRRRREKEGVEKSLVNKTPEAFETLGTTSVFIARLMARTSLSGEAGLAIPKSIARRIVVAQ